MRTHGHGQGYLDVNGLIPETIDRIDYRKGTYRADTGDFSMAGASFMTTVKSVEPFVGVGSRRVRLAAPRCGRHDRRWARATHDGWAMEDLRRSVGTAGRSRARIGLGEVFAIRLVSVRSK